MGRPDWEKLAFKPPVPRDDLLRFSEDDPEGADDFLELLREFIKEALTFAAWRAEEIEVPLQEN